MTASTESESGRAVPARVDRLAELAVRLLGATVAMFVVGGTNKLRLMSLHGLEADTRPAIPAVRALDQVLLVPDLAVDPRPLAAAWRRLNPHARALALVPAHAPNGALVGALIVLDTHVRAWPPADAALLENLAALGGEMAETLAAVARRFSPNVAGPARAQGAAERNDRAQGADEPPARVGVERTKSEAARARSGQYRALARNLPDGVVVLFDHELRVTLAAGAALAEAGFTDIEGKTLAEVFPPEAIALCEPDYHAALAGAPTVREVPLGDRVYLTRTHPVRAENGEISGGMVVTQDITQRVAAENALRASEERYRVLFEDAAEPIIAYRIDGEPRAAIVAANPAAAAIGGYTVDELLGLTLTELTAPEMRAELPARFAKLLAEGWNEGETVLRKKDGTYFTVEFRTGLAHLGSERVALSVAHDVTERRRMEQELREAKDAAEAGSRTKSAFLANMSHEIRTPLNAILGYAQLLGRAPELSRAQREGLEIINRGGEQLLALINGVLDLSKIEAGFVRLATRDVDLWALLTDMELMFRPLADAKGLGFEMLRGASVPSHIRTDEVKLRQVLTNLLNNAIKFTERGGVVGRVAARATEASTPTLVVEVEDTGPGVAPAEMHLLFRPFGQTRVGIHARGGTGLGLAICREFARCMGGDVTAESRLGVGSVFRLELPLETGTPSVAAPAPPAGRVLGVTGGARPIRVLVVDDDDDNRGWVVRLLADVGFDVRETADGAAVAAAFDAFGPQLVLLDMNMPLVDGCDVIRALRACAGGGDTAIVALTASAFDSERKAIRAAGADGCLLKPCREDDLFAEARRLLGVEYQYAAESRRQPKAKATPLGIRTMRRGLAGALSPDLVRGLRDAARAADYERLVDLLAHVPAEFAAVAEGLRGLVECYAYDAVEAALAD